MARYRQIHVKIWKDGWFLDLSPKHKLFFIYLFSNERASIAGIYELPIAVMAFESGLSRDEICEAFEVFSEADKAYYQDDVVWVTKLRDYHETTSAQLQKGIQNEINEVKDCPLKRRYLNHYGVAATPEESAEKPQPQSEHEQGYVGDPPFDGNGAYEEGTKEGVREGIDRVSRPSIMSMSHSKSKSTQGVGGTGEGEPRPAGSDAEILSFLDENNIVRPETDREWQKIRHPAVWAWINVTRRFPGFEKLPAIIRRLGDEPDCDRLRLAWQDWVASDYNKGNVTGILDFYDKQAEARASPNGRGRQDEPELQVDEDGTW